MPLFRPPRIGPAATAVGRATADPSTAMDVVAELALPALFLRWGPFPAVLAVEGQTGGWDHVGATRHPQFADGGQATETIVERVPGVGFAYELTRFTDVFDRLIVGVRGEWTFMPDGTGSVIRWTWEFRPRFGRRLIVAAVIVPLWQGAMGAVMRRTVAALEQAIATPSTAGKPPGTA